MCIRVRRSSTTTRKPPRCDNKRTVLSATVNNGVTVEADVIRESSKESLHTPLTKPSLLTTTVLLTACDITCSTHMAGGTCSAKTRRTGRRADSIGIVGLYLGLTTAPTPDTTGGHGGSEETKNCLAPEQEQYQAASEQQIAPSKM